MPAGGKLQLACIRNRLAPQRRREETSCERVRPMVLFSTLIRRILEHLTVLAVNCTALIERHLRQGKTVGTWWSGAWRNYRILHYRR